MSGHTTPPEECIGTRYTVESLLRGDEPGKRACADTRDLIQLVHYLPEGSGVRLVLHSAGDSRRVHAFMETFGSGADALSAADLAYACSLSLTMDAGRPGRLSDGPRQIASAYELVPVQPAPFFEREVDEPDPAVELLGATRGAGRTVPTQPVPALDSAGALLGALSRAAADTWAVTTLASPSPLDQRLALDELDAVAGGRLRAASAGAIVCARTIVASARPVSPAVLAGLAKRSNELQAVPIDPAQAYALWSAPAREVQGHAMIEGHAVALTRVPAAGTGRGLGIPSRRPEPERRSLDPLLPDPVVPVRLGTAVDVAGGRVDVILDAQDARRHIAVEGKTGSGKSAFLKNVCVSWLDTSYPLIVLDPHGDVAQAVAAHSAERRGRTTWYVRHGDTDHPIGLNVIGGGDAETRERNVDALLDHMQQVIDPRSEGMFGERAKRTFWLVAEAASHVYGGRLTVQIVQTLLLEQRHVRQLADRVEAVAPAAAKRVRAELGNLADKEWSELVSWYQSRFQMWQKTRALREITGTGIDAIDMSAVLDGQADLVVDLASPQLGDTVAGILGGIYLRKVRDTMGRRSDRDVPVLLVFDEAQRFRDEAPDRLLAEGRKYGLSLVIATQSIEDLAPRLARAVEANVGSFVSLRTGLNGAGAASARLGGWPAGDLIRLPDLTAAASLSSRGIPIDPFTLHVDYYERLEASGWTTDRLAATAGSVAARTLQELWLPHAGASVPSDDDVIAALRPPIAAPSRGVPRPGKPWPELWPEEQGPLDAAPDVSSALDTWYASRSAVHLHTVEGR